MSQSYSFPVLKHLKIYSWNYFKHNGARIRDSNLLQSNTAQEDWILIGRGLSTKSKAPMWLKKPDNFVIPGALTQRIGNLTINRRSYPWVVVWLSIDHNGTNYYRPVFGPEVLCAQTEYVFCDL